MLKIGVLASGEGTNFQAIADFLKRSDTPGQLVMLISNRKDAGALRRASNEGIKNLYLAPRDYPNKTEYDKALISELQKEEVELVILAGYMKLLTALFIDAYPGKIMNIHPSLLPAFPGLDGVRQAMRYGVKITGCTVHFVDKGLDTGPIILQDSVPVLQEDTEETLQQRVHASEHRIYPRAVDLFCRGKIKVTGRRCIINGKKE